MTKKIVEMYAKILILLWLFTSSISAPLNQNVTEETLEKSLDNFIELYYEKFIKNSVEKKLHDFVKSVNPEENNESGNIYDRMQGDQPKINEEDLEDLSPINQTQSDYIRTMMDRYHERDFDARDRERMIQKIKDNVLFQTGRSNTSLQTHSSETKFPNISQWIQEFVNVTSEDEDQITEKMRSFYPSCEIPQNTDHEFWKEDNVMNLFFNFDYNSNEKNSNIATATLRLYRIPLENSTKTMTKNPDCDQSVHSDEEKLIRISIYWYTKSLKRRRVKRRLSDSKMIPESSLWVELDIKPATKAWGKGRNLGLGILVEDQDGNVLKADKYFKGATCMVGTSTPKPIPTIIIDRVRNEHLRIHNLSRENISSAIYSDLQLLPTIDICTLEFPDNQSLLSSQIGSLRINKCNLKKFHEESQRMVEKEHRERIVAGLHIRHQRQYLANKNHGENADVYDPRSSIINSRIVLSNEELLRKYNITTIQ